MYLSYRAVVVLVQRVAEGDHGVSHVLEQCFLDAEVGHRLLQPLVEPLSALWGGPLRVRGHDEHAQRPRVSLGGSR